MFVESRVRSLAKSVSWRAFGTLVTVLIVFALSGRWTLAIGAGLLEAFSKILVFFAHERLWNVIPFGRRQIEPVVVWLTGLSGAGKTTLAMRLKDSMTAKGLRVEFLDGDSLRTIFPKTGFSRDERDNHIRRVGHLASTLERNGVSVVVALVSPYASSRSFVRGQCRNFIEVYVATPLETCEARDTKGLYAAARAGRIVNFTGLDDPYEPPTAPELSVCADGESLETAYKRLEGTVWKRVGL